MKNVRIKKGNKLQGTHGDIWPMTWVGDVTYAVGNDSTGCPDFLYNHSHPRCPVSPYNNPGRNVIFTVMRGGTRELPSTHRKLHGAAWI